MTEDAIPRLHEAEPRPELLSRDELEELRAGLTMLDVYRARKGKDEDRGLVAYFEAAKRVGLINGGTDLEGFLGRIKAEDFNAIMGQAGKEPDPATELHGGESGPTSSSGTDTDLETSSSSP